MTYFATLLPDTKATCAIGVVCSAALAYELSKWGFSSAYVLNVCLGLGRIV